MDIEQPNKRGRKFGSEHSKATKKLMSEAKKGKLHPKFKGHYFVKWKRYESARQASKITGIAAKTIINRCKNPKFKVDGYYFVPICENSI